MLASAFSKLILAIFVSTLHAHYTTAFEGDATWYNVGLGTCGVTNTNTQLVVALSTVNYESGANCGRTVTATYGGKSVTVTVEDLCSGCGIDDIALSPGAFEALASLSLDRLSDVFWNYD